jgi:hypothetical protein
MDMSLLGVILGVSSTDRDSQSEIERLKNLGNENTKNNKDIANKTVSTNKFIPTKSDCQYIHTNGILILDYRVIEGKGQFLESHNELSLIHI